MGYAKKTTREKWATRAAQNSRYRDKKAQQGLKAVTVYVPIDALEQVKDLRKIGLIVAEDGVLPMVVKVRKEGGRLIWDVLVSQLNLLLQET